VKRFLLNPRLALLLLLLSTTFGLTACSTTEDSDNASVRPWNTPKGWETGLPSNMTEGR
jgi:hypothetical protein